MSPKSRGKICSAIFMVDDVLYSEGAIQFPEISICPHCSSEGYKFFCYQPNPGFLGSEALVLLDILFS